MIVHEVLWNLFHIFVVMGFVVIFSGVITMGVYDVRRAKEQRRFKLDISYRYKARFRVKPSVTILVSAYNEALVIQRCLESISKIQYKKLKVVIVSDGSKDNTATIVRRFIKMHPRLNMRLVNLRRNRGKGGALNYALKKYCDTELLMVLDADSTLRSDALKKAVEYFKDPRVVGLATNVRIAERPRLLSYLQKIEHLIGYRQKKFYSVTNSEFIIGGQGGTYRTDIVKKVKGFDERMMTEDIALSLSITSLGNKAHRLVYASDVLSFTEAPPNLKSLYKQRYRWKIGGMQAIFAYRYMVMSRSADHSRMLTFVRLPQAVFGELILMFEPLLLTLFLIIAISTMNPMVFFGGWLTLTVYALSIILIDEYSSRKERLVMLAITPFMYPFFFIFMVINIIALVQCIRNWKRITGRDATKGVWISPDRIGHQIVS